MPQIEILPNTGAAPAPGWAYVPDTGYDPSKVAINPKDRKRIAARPGGVPSGNELSARQQTAIQRRLVELEKDNNSRETIIIPGKGELFPRTAGRTKRVADGALLQLSRVAPKPPRRRKSLHPKRTSDIG